MTISDSSALWDRIDHVTLGMSRTTFDTQVRGITAISLEDDVMTLQAMSANNLEWLERRLKGLIEQGLSSLAGRSLRVRFVLAGDVPAPSSPPPATPDGQMLAQVNHALAGFNQYTHYLIRFWRAYIGANAFDLWQYVRSFCKDGSLTWTPVRDFTVSELARGADCGRQRITGVWRSCPLFDRTLFEEGRVLARCCEQYEFREPGEWPQLTKPTDDHPQGRPTCRHWVHGALEILQAEGLAVYQRRGDQPRNTFHSIQVYQHPPVLTPKQAARFDSKLRIDHRRMLYGLLKAHQAQNGAWHYGLEQWEREDIYSGLAVIPREEVLAGLELPLPDEGVFGAVALNNIFFASSSSANEQTGTAQE